MTKDITKGTHTYDWKPKHLYKVTRTWYLTATSCTEAISKSNQVLHQGVRARKMGEIKEDTNE